MHFIYLFLGLSCFFLGVQSYAPNASSTYRVVSSPTYLHTLTVANLELDLFPSVSSASPDLFIPAESFICPGTDLCTPPACVCDFSASCAALPACCATDPEFSTLYLFTCGPSSPPQVWAPLAAHVATPVTLTASPLHFRYQPTAEGYCRGFGISLIPDPAYNSSSLVFSVLALVSFTTPYPEADLYSYRIQFTPDVDYNLRQHYRFCPSSSFTKSLNPAEAYVGFIGPTNHRTAFISLISTAFNADALTLYPTQAILRVIETNDVTLQSLPLPAPALPNCVPSHSVACMPDQTSVFNNLATGQSDSFLYQHQGADCTILAADLRTLFLGNANIYASKLTDSLSPSFNDAMWWSLKKGYDSIDIYVCPGDAIVFTVELATNGPDVYIFSLSTAAPHLELNLRTDINPLVLAPFLEGSSRLVCTDPTIPSFRKSSSGEALFNCLSWFGKFQEDCEIYYPVLSSTFQNPIFPSIPNHWQNYVDYFAFNLTRIFDFQPISQNLQTYQATIILTSVNGPTSIDYLSVEQISSCHIEFTNRLRDGSGRIYSESAPNFRPAASLCNSADFTVAYDRASGIYHPLLVNFQYSWFATYAFIGTMATQIPAFADCSSLVNGFQVASQSVLEPPLLCSDPYNACCSDRLPVTLLYQACEPSVGVNLTTFRTDLIEVDATCNAFEQCMEALDNEVSSEYSYSTGQDIDKCRGNSGLAATVLEAILPYVINCRESVLGPTQMGFPCLTDTDCPVGFSCIFNPQADPFSGFVEGACLAPAAVADQLLFNCLIQEMPYVLIQITGSALGFAYSDPRFAPTLYAFWTGPGCGSLFPDQYSSFLQVHYELDPVPSSCTLDDWCSDGLLCVDTACRSPYPCSSPFSSCSHTWSPAFDLTLTPQTCTAHFRCNVLSPTGQPITCTDPTGCDAVCPSDTFCGACSASGSVCYELIGGSPSQCPQQGCLVRGIEQLLPLSECQASKGYCTIPDQTGDHLTTQAECETRGVCTFGAGTPPFTGGFCLSGPSGTSPACPTSVSSPVGCILIDPTTRALLVPQSQCFGPDPYYPLANLTWIPPITSATDCLNHPALQLCFLSEFAPPTYYPAPLCHALGGTIRPALTYKVGAFIPGEVTDLSVLPRTLWPQTNYTANRLKFANVLATSNSVAALMRSLDLTSQSICRLSGPLLSAATAASCLCSNETHNGQGICASLYDVTTIPSPSFIGIAYVCTSTVNTVDMGPLLIYAYPQTTVTSSLSVYVNCIAGALSYSSTTVFNSPRTRTRSTDFYVSRQDIHIPPRAVFNDRGNVVGQILSDGVYIRDLFDEFITVVNVTICIRVRADFVAEIQNSPELAYLVTDFQLGLIDPHFQTVSPLPNAQPSVVYRVGTVPNGTAFENLRYIEAVCNYFETSAVYLNLVAISISQDPQSAANGFSNTENNVLIATATFYLVPLAFFLLPLLVSLPLSRGLIAFNLNYWCLSTIAIFFLLRAVLLYCFAGGEIEPNSLAEFAVSSFATLALYFSLFLAGFCIYRLMSSADQNKAVGSIFDRTTLLVVGGTNLTLALILTGFLIAVSITGSVAGNLSTTYIDCLGRLINHEEFWSTTRIIRFTFSSIITVVTLCLSLFLFYLIHLLSKSESNPSILRLIVSNIIAAVALLVHSIIALILLGTDYNNFAFEISMLWITEIVPYTIYILLTSWNLQKAFYSRISFSRSKSRSSGAGTGSKV